jgi:acyl carrier protein
MSATQRANAATGADAVALAGELRDLLVQISEGKLDAASIDPSVNLFDFGYIDSLTGVMFIAEIESRYGVQIEDLELVERLNTLERIAEHVAARS